MDKKYSVTIIWSEEDQVFLALAPEMHENFVAHGDTRKKALKKLKDLVKAYKSW